jgi:excisionase family DNA binding protein
VSWSDGRPATCNELLIVVFGEAMRRLLTMSEASEYLGISKLTLYDWVCCRKISFVKVGRLVKFREEHLEKWIEARTVKARGTHGTDETPR